MFEHFFFKATNMKTDHIFAICKLEVVHHPSVLSVDSPDVRSAEGTRVIGNVLQLMNITLTQACSGKSNNIDPLLETSREFVIFGCNGTRQSNPRS